LPSEAGMLHFSNKKIGLPNIFMYKPKEIRGNKAQKVEFIAFGVDKGKEK
jgi:hypothetical protein